MFDFLAFEEAQAPIHPIGQRGIEQRMLEYAGLSVGSIQQCDLREPDRARAQCLDLIDDEGSFFQIRGGLVQSQRLAAAFCGPQILTQAIVVVADECVRRIEDVALAPIVLLELDHAPLRELALEVEHVARGSAAKSIDRLIVVADCEDRVVAAGEQLEPAILEQIGVLELVDQDVRETLLIVRPQNLVT